jgi:TonB family protein
MWKKLEKYAAALVITFSVIGINIGLFALFPFFHGLFGEKLDKKAASLRPQQVIMEYRKPEEKKVVVKERVVREVNAPQHRQHGQQLKFRFTPDLAIEGTGEVAMAPQELTAVIFEEGETDEPAIPLYQTPIPYPERARELEIEGVLECIIVIDTNGKVASINIVRSPHSSITRTAKKVIASWRFKPARNKGVPVKVRVRQVIEFTLD